MYKSHPDGYSHKEQLLGYAAWFKDDYAPGDYIYEHRFIAEQKIDKARLW